MPAYFFDAINGSDANDGLSPGAPKRSYDAWRQAGNQTFFDIIHLRRGQDHVQSTSRSIPNGTQAQRTIMRAYGEAQVPWAKVSNPSGSGNYIFNMSQRSWNIFEDIWFEGSRALLQPIYVSSTAAGVCIGHIFRRCLFSGATGDTPGLYIGRENTTNASFGHLVEDCEFFDNSGSGVTLMGVQDVTIRRCKAWGNGATAFGGGHGIHVQSRRTTVSSGWTLVSGNVYSRPLNAHETDVFFMQHPSYVRMTKNIATPTTPALGEFGVSGGLIYINAGANPNGVSVIYIWVVSTGILYEQCEAWGNKFGIAAFQEGHGFSFDDWASNCVMRGCVSRDNEGLGISINGGDNNVLEGNVVYGNEARGIAFGSGVGNVAQNNTLWLNNRGRGAAGTEIGGSLTAANSVARNNLVLTGRITGIDFGGASGCVATNNLVFGNTGAAIVGGTITGTITTDPRPLLDGALVPIADTYSIGSPHPFANAGVWVDNIHLRNGRARPGQVPVGAYRAMVRRNERI